jgi:hypothetical protein
MRTITLHSLKIMESFDNRFTSQVDFNIIHCSNNGVTSEKCIMYTGCIVDRCIGVNRNNVLRNLIYWEI